MILYYEFLFLKGDLNVALEIYSTTDDTLAAICFKRNKTSRDQQATYKKLHKTGAEIQRHPSQSSCAQELQEYCAGMRKKFTIRYGFFWGTVFQQEVWRVLGKIPYSITLTYADIVEQVARPKAWRAVGTAIAQNPMPIVLPCHRVIPRRGGLGNYAGGVLVKQKLLDMERKTEASRGRKAM